MYNTFFRSFEKIYKPKVGKKYYRVWTDMSISEFPSCCGAIIMHDVNTFHEYFSGKDEDDWQYENSGVPNDPEFGVSPKKYYEYVLKEFLSPRMALKEHTFDSPFRNMNIYSVVHVMCAHEFEQEGTITEFVRCTKDNWIFPGRMIANRKPGHGNYLFHAMMYLHKDTKLMTLKEVAKSRKEY